MQCSYPFTYFSHALALAQTGTVWVLCELASTDRTSLHMPACHCNMQVCLLTIMSHGKLAVNSSGTHFVHQVPQIVQHQMQAQAQAPLSQAAHQVSPSPNQRPQVRCTAQMNQKFQVPRVSKTANRMLSHSPAVARGCQKRKKKPLAGVTDRV